MTWRDRREQYVGGVMVGLGVLTGLLIGAAIVLGIVRIDQIVGGW